MEHLYCVFVLMIRRPPRATQSRSSAASDVYKRQHSLLDNIIYAIAQDKNSGKLWIGSRSGVSILEDESGDGNFTNIVPGNLQGDLPFNEVNSLLCSKDGLMWLGMLGGGVCTVNTNKFRFNYDSLEALREHCPVSYTHLTLLTIYSV